MQTIPNAGAYFELIASTFAEAVRAAGRVRTKTIDLAGQQVQLNFAGDALVGRIFPALAHLQVLPIDADLRIYLYDSASTSIPFYFPAPAVEKLYRGNEVWLYRDDSCSILLDPHVKTLTMLDRTRGAAFFWTQDANALAYHETSFPLRILWQWWFQPRGLQLAHAAAVANENGAAVIAGASGAGKSTVALACLNSPLNYLGDDFVLLRARPTPGVYSLYCSAKLEPDHWRRFSHLQNTVSNSERLDSEKALMFLDQTFSDKLLPYAPVRAFLIPQVVGTGGVQLHKISPGRALQKTAVSTLSLLVGSGKEELNTLAELVQSLPCYQIELGADLTEIPVVIQTLLGSL